MKVPVIRGRIGRWRYYAGVLTFKQISDRVSPSINDLYPSKSLSTLLQRELTDNFKSIKEISSSQNDVSNKYFTYKLVRCCYIRRNMA